jgi:hypothetical protein
MLTVGDDQLDTRDSEGTLFRCCQGRDTCRKSHRGQDTCRMAPSSHVDKLRREREHVRSWGCLVLSGMGGCRSSS